MNRIIYLLLIILFLITSSLFAQWISFDGRTQASKPHVTILSNDKTSIILEISLPGMEINKRTEQGKTYDVLRLPGIFQLQK